MRYFHLIFLLLLTGLSFFQQANGQCPDPYSNTVSIKNQDTIICKGASVVLSAEGGTNYLWSPAESLNCNTCSSATANPTVTTTYHLSAENAGCPAADSVIVSVITSPEIFAGPDVNVCQNGSVFLAAVGNGDYHWYPANGLSCTNCSNPVCSPAMSTTYTVTNTVCGSASSEIIVRVVPKPFIATTPDITICKGYGDTIAVSAVAPGGTYNWSPAAGLNCTDCQKPYASPMTSTTFLIVLNNKGCQSKDSVVVSVIDMPLFDAGNDTTICFGHAAHLHANSADSYSWIPTGYLSSNTIADPIASPTLTTKYIVEGKRTCGTLTDSVTVFVKQKPVVTTSADTSLCSGQSVQLYAEGGDTYEWIPAAGLNNTDSSNPIATPKHSSTYLVRVYNFPDCYSEAEVKVHIIPFPKISLDNEADIVCGQPLQLKPVVSDYTFYHWKPGQGIKDKDTLQLAPFVSPLNTSTYTFIASNQNCEESADIIVNVQKGDLGFPSAFSPNGDGHNDIFRLKQTCGFTVTDFRIYNRWGQIVFRSLNPTDGWDGKYHNTEAESGVYVYVLSGNTDSNEKITLKGSVTLLR